MSFSNEGGGTSHAGSSGPAHGEAPAHQDIGHQLTNFLSQKYPIAGGLAHMVFGNGGPPESPTGSGTGAAMAQAPLPQMPEQSTPDFSMLAANAKPPENSGLKNIIMQLLAG